MIESGRVREGSGRDGVGRERGKHFSAVRKTPRISH